MWGSHYMAALFNCIERLLTLFECMYLGILKRIDNELLNKIMGFCYSRTRDSCEAEELCSDIIYELVKTGQGNGDITEFNAFMWKTGESGADR